MNAFERDALYGAQTIDRRLAVRVDRTGLSQFLAAASKLRSSAVQAAEALAAFGHTLAATSRRDLRRVEHYSRHKPRWINGRLRAMTAKERAKRRKRHARRV